jgi:hypothetical protein
MRFGMAAGHTLVARRGGRRGGVRAAVGASQPVPRDGSLITAWREKRGCAPPLEPAEASPLKQQVDPHSSACVVGSFGSSSGPVRHRTRTKHSLRLAIERSLLTCRAVFTSVTTGGSQVDEGAIAGTCSMAIPGVDRGGLSRFLRAQAKALGVTLGQRMSDLRRCSTARTCARSSRMRRW